LKKINLAIVVAVLTGLFSANGFAESYSWLVHELSKSTIKKTGKSAASILKDIPQDTIIDIPVSWASKTCDYSKSITTFKDKLGRNVASCSYLGTIRNKIK
jgi:hypothetical protein